MPGDSGRSLYAVTVHYMNVEHLLVHPHTPHFCTSPGQCYRLYTRTYYERKMPDATEPEIQRTSLAGAVLHLKSLDLDIDVLSFEFLDAPAPAALSEALRQLYVLDAIDADGQLTQLGKKMAVMPLEPSLARALFAAQEYG